jgi:hypothetical protein
MIRGLLLLPLAPVRGVAWIAGVLAGEAERERAERESPQRALNELQAALANGEITAQEAEAREAELLDRVLAGHSREAGT